MGASQTGRVFGASYLFELPAVARVDDGVQAAVEVAQPKNDFKKCVRWTKTGVEGACGNKHTQKMTVVVIISILIGRAESRLDPDRLSGKPPDHSSVLIS